MKTTFWPNTTPIFCAILFKHVSISRPCSKTARISFSTEMGIECQILLRKAKEGVFRPGEAVMGTLKYFINEPTKFESIDLSFVGNGKCQWSEYRSKNSTVTYSNEEDYVNINNNVFSPREDENVLVSGAFEYPFEFLVPDDIPTSLKNPTCTIEYKVIATFVKESFFESRKVFDAEVPVYGYVNPCSPEPLVFGLEKDVFSLVNTSNFNVKAEIDKTFVTPGENITLTITVENNSDIPIIIKTKLVKYFTYIAESGENKRIETQTVDTTKRYSPVIEENSVKKLTHIVPTLPSLYSIQHTKILTGEYKVRVTAKVPFPHINDKVEVPVVIGEKKDHLGVATLGIEDDPPSYSP